MKKESDLQGWSRVIHASFERSQKDEEEFNATLPPPDAMFEDIGYWKAEGGIVSYRKSPRGNFHRHSENFISYAQLDAMNKARSN